MAKFVLAGGGTGGHVYPALAIGDVLRARGHEVMYYGDADRLEARVAPQRGYTFRTPSEALWADRIPGVRKLTERSRDWREAGDNALTEE